MQDGSGSINIDVKVNLDNIKKLANGFSDLQTITKNADYQFRQQKITFDELGVTLNAVNTRAKELNGSYKQYVDLNASVFQVTQRAENNFKSLSGSLNDIHNSIRQRTAPSMMAFSGIVQDSTQFTAGFGQGMRAVGNNIEFMTQTMMQAANSGMTFKQIMQGMISNLAGPSGILLAVSAVTMLVTVFGDKLFPSVEKANKELEKTEDLINRINSAEFGANIIASTERKAHLYANLVSAQQKLNEAQSGSPARSTSYGITNVFGFIPALVSYQTEDTKGYEEQLNQRRIAYAQAVKDYNTFSVSMSNGMRDLSAAEYDAGIISERQRKQDLIKIQEDAKRKLDLSILNNSNSLSEDRLAYARAVKEYKNFLKELDDIRIKNEKDRWDDPYGVSGSANPHAKMLGESGYFRGMNLPSVAAPEGMISKLIGVDRQNDLDKLEFNILSNKYYRNKGKEQEDAIKLLIEENAILVDSMLSGFGAVGNAIQNDIHDGLVNAFDGANTYAQKFIVGLLDGITAISTKLASTAAVSGILSLVTGKSFGGIFDAMSGGLSKALGYADGGIIPEPVFGIGASGRAYTFAERGPEYVSSNASLRSAMNDRYSSGDGGVARAIRNIQWSATVSSEGLRVATVRANAKRQLNQVR